MAADVKRARAALFRAGARAGVRAGGLRAGGARALPPVIVMTDAARRGPAEALARALPRGTALCLRDYGHPARAALAHHLARLCRARGIAFSVAGDVRLAIACGADGVHMPEAMARAHRLPLAIARAQGLCVTMAAHGPDAAAFAARAAGGLIDAVLISPVFATASHPRARPLGPLGFQRVRAAAPGIAAYALGGMTAETCRRLGPAGPDGIAGIGF